MAGDHFYTIFTAERDATIQRYNYKSQETACWVIALGSPLINPIGVAA
ncbi:hypothetical protein V1287_003136 [Bradyrhizobium sp. AZCC 1699]